MPPPPKKKKKGLAALGGSVSGGAGSESPADNSYSSMLSKDVMYGQSRLNPDSFTRATPNSTGSDASLDMDINQPVMDPKQSLQNAVGPRIPMRPLPRLQGKPFRMAKKITPMRGLAGLRMMTATN